MELIMSMIQSPLAIGFITTASIGVLYSLYAYLWSSYWLWKIGENKKWYWKSKSLYSALSSINKSENDDMDENFNPKIK